MFCWQNCTCLENAEEGEVIFCKNLAKILKREEWTFYANICPVLHEFIKCILFLKNSAFSVIIQFHCRLQLSELIFIIVLVYSKSQIYEYIARAHEMSSWNLFQNVWQRLFFLIGLSFKGLNTIYENISIYHCRVLCFFDNF